MQYTGNMNVLKVKAVVGEKKMALTKCVLRITSIYIRPQDYHFRKEGTPGCEGKW